MAVVEHGLPRDTAENPLPRRHPRGKLQGVPRLQSAAPPPSLEQTCVLRIESSIGRSAGGIAVDARKDLGRVAFWADALTEAEAARALKGITERNFGAGAYICHRGDRLDYWTGVTSGLVKISAISESGKAVTFAGAGAGGWFGEGTVLKGEARQYDLVALRDTSLAMMNRATFMWLFENSIGFTRFLVHQLNERMGQFNATIETDRIHDPTPRDAPPTISRSARRNWPCWQA
jgi:CRP-like cAMP-binding protein